MASALAGGRRDERSALAWDREASPELRAERELALALLEIEAGRPECAAVYLERAQPSGAGEAVLAAILQAQVHLLRDDAASAARSAAAGLDGVPATETGSAAWVYGCLVSAESALASGDIAAADTSLGKAAAAPGCTGLLAARLARLQAQSVAATDPGATRMLLDLAIERCTLLGAQRDLGLSFLARALVTGQPPGEANGWLARAQPLLARTGGPRDLQLLREAFRRFGRRRVDRLEHDVGEAMDELRSHSARLYDLLSAERAAIREQAGPLADPVSLESLADAMRESEERLIGALERTLVERGQMEQLVAAGQELAAIEGLEELQARAPSLAIAFFPAGAAQLVRLREREPLAVLAAAGAEEAVDPARTEKLVREALQSGTFRLLDDGHGSARQDTSHGSLAALARIAVIPLTPASEGLALVVGRSAAGALLTARDVQQLSLYGSLVSAALARARTSAQLHASRARDSALLGAIRDGVAAVDAEGTVLALNQSGAAHLGISREAALGRRLSELPGLLPLERLLRENPSQIGELGLPHGNVAIRSHPYEGGVVVILRDLATAHTIAHQLVGNAARFTFEDLVGADPAFLACLEDAKRAAAGDSPVLIVGESGTGKELLAQALHNASARASSPFVGVNVAAIPRELLESELFGYDSGAFTGARAGGHAGKFELAGKGTLLLDEIGEMPLDMQVKLLRVLQERVVQRLGGRRDVPVRARIVASTQRDPEDGVREGLFRLDLYHRLRVVHLRVPPLRDRRGDVLLLARHTLDRLCRARGRAPIGIAPAVQEALEAYEWPGNVRELVNLLDGEVSLLPPDRAALEQVPAALQRARSRRDRPADGVAPLAEVEREACQRALDFCGGNVARAAVALGVAKATLYAMIRRHGIDRGAAAKPG